MVQKVKKSDVSVVSKTAFVKNPQFDVDTQVEQIKYNSATTKRPRWMVALTEASAKKLTAEQKQTYCTVENGHTYVHVDHQNISGKVQFGTLPWSDKGLLGFFNVKADTETLKKYNADKALVTCKEQISAIDDLLKADIISKEEYANQKAEILQEYRNALKVDED